MMKSVKMQKGFTLMEIVLSVAIIAIISLFILQFFVVSSNANKKAQNTDTASSKAQEAIELLKSVGYDEIFEQKLFEHAKIIDFKDSLDDEIILYYDKNWKYMPYSETSSAAFVMRITFGSGEKHKSSSDDSNKLVKLDVTVRDTSYPGGKDILVHYETYKFYR